MLPLTNSEGERLCVGVYLDPDPPWVAAIADADAPSYGIKFSRDLTVAFDGTNWWFGYALWLNLGKDNSIWALTYASSNQQITLTAYTQGAATPNQIWGMRGANGPDEDRYNLIQTYDVGANQVMDLDGGQTAVGTPVLTYKYNNNQNQLWQYQDA